VPSVTVGAPVTMTWDEAIEQWRTVLVAQGYPASTIRLRTGWVRRMGAWVGVGPWEVDEDHLTAWGGAHEWARNTRRAAYASVTKFYAWAEAAGHVTDSPAACPPLVQPAGRHRPLPPGRPACLSSSRQARDLTRVQRT